MRKSVRLALVSAAVLLLAEEELKNPIVKPRLSAAVLGPRFSSPWTRFWRTGMDSDFIYTMGLDRAAFKVLLHDFKHFYDNCEIATLKKLKPSKFTHHGNRALDAAGALALVLHWLNSKAINRRYNPINRRLSRLFSIFVNLLFIFVRKLYCRSSHTTRSLARYYHVR